MRGSPSNDPAVDNRVRFSSKDGGGHVESHFMRANSPDGERALWVKHTILSPAGVVGGAVAEAWAIAFRRGAAANVGVKSTVPISAARFVDSPFRIETGEAVLEQGAARGAADSGGHRIEWDLRFDASAPSFHPFPLERMYEAPFPRSKTLTPCPDTRFDGSFVVDGEEWTVDGWPGMQGHNWGRSHAEAYAWVHCNAWDEGSDGPSGPGGLAGPNGPAWLEAITGRIKLGPVLTPWLSLAALHIDGETHRFDGARALTSRAVDVSWYRLRLGLVKGARSLRIDVEAPRQDMAGLHYENPDGSMTHCLNSKLATGTVTLSLPGRPDRVLRSDRLALELGTKDRGHGVEMLV